MWNSIKEHIYFPLFIRYSPFNFHYSLKTVFIHDTITVLASLPSCLLALDLFWVLSQSRWQQFIQSITRWYVIPPQLLWNGAQPQFYLRHLKCVSVLQLYTSDIYLLLQTTACDMTCFSTISIINSEEPWENGNSFCDKYVCWFLILYYTLHM